MSSVPSVNDNRMQPKNSHHRAAKDFETEQGGTLAITQPTNPLSRKDRVTLSPEALRHLKETREKNKTD